MSERPVPKLTGRRGTITVSRALTGAIDAPITQVLHDPKQPRRSWNPEQGDDRLAELAASIRAFGVLQPLLVRMDPAGTETAPLYRIIAGGRRRAAAEQAGLTTIPVVVHEAEGARVRMLQLIENLQRQDLAPMDEARAYKELMDLDEISAHALAERLHISSQTIRDRLRVLGDQVLADAVESRQISATAARDISRLPDEQFHEFRARVESGAVIQSNDVAAALAELRASGFVHPRLKRAVARPSVHTSYETVVPLELPARGAEPVTAPPTESRSQQEQPAGDGHAVAPLAVAQGASPSVDSGTATTGDRDQPTLMPTMSIMESRRVVVANRLLEVFVDSLLTVPDVLAQMEETLAEPGAAEWSLRVFTEAARRVREHLTRRP